MKSFTIRTFSLFLIILFSTVSFIQSQENDQIEDSLNQANTSEKIYQLSGLIINDTLSSLPFVTIAIINRNQGTVSDFWGYYSIPVQKNDTVRFSSVGYKSYSFTLPSDFEENDYDLNVQLMPDTVYLKEAVVFPWSTYDQFLRAVVELELQQDDLIRAKNNIALLQRQLFSDEYQADASLNYKYFMDQKINRAYTAGQYPSVSLLNPLAWAQFFQALKDGLFKKKTKIY